MFLSNPLVASDSHSLELKLIDLCSLFLLLSLIFTSESVHASLYTPQILTGQPFDPMALSCQENL